MPKMKTKKAIKSRFKCSAGGKLLRSKQGKRHIMTKKTPKRKRQLRGRAIVSEGFAKLYKRLINAA